MKPLLLERRSGFSYQHPAGGIVFGVRGRLRLGPFEWPSVERGGLLHLTPGVYAGEMGLWTSTKGKQARALRVVLTDEQFRALYPPAEWPIKGRGRIYLHPANYPHELEGCIAPGCLETAHGVADARLALRQLFACLGGWRAGKAFALEVTGDHP